MTRKNAFLLGVAGLFLGVMMIGQVSSSSQTQETKIKKVPITASESNSGKQMYQDYCAACHGMEGKGNGPAASALSCKELPDLTTIAQRRKEKSAALIVQSVLQFGTGDKAHGTPDMPIWGPVFRSLGEGDSVVKLRIYNLSEYVNSMQVK